MDALPIQPPHHNHNHNDISSPTLNTFNFSFNHAMNPTVNPSNAINAQSPPPPPPPHLSIVASETPVNNNIITSSMNNHHSDNPDGGASDASGEPSHSKPGALQLPFPSGPHNHGRGQPPYDDGNGVSEGLKASTTAALQQPSPPNIVIPFPSATSTATASSAPASGGGGGTGGLLPFEETFFTSSCRLAPPASAPQRSNSVAALVESPSFTQSPVTPLLFSSANRLVSQQVPNVHTQGPPVLGSHPFVSSNNSNNKAEGGGEIESPVSSQHIQPAVPKVENSVFNSFSAFNPSTSAAPAGSTFVPPRTSPSSFYPTPYSPLPLPLNNSYNNILGPPPVPAASFHHRLPLPPPPPPTPTTNSFTNTLRGSAHQSNVSINVPMIPVRKRSVPPCDDVANVLLPFTSSSEGVGTTVRFENASPDVHGHGHISRDTLLSPPLPPSVYPNPSVTQVEQETIGVRYKTPIERLPEVENGKRIGEASLARCRALPWYLKETELRIQRTLGLAGEMWQGPAHNNNGNANGSTQSMKGMQNIRYRYPRGEDDVDTLLDEASMLEQSWYLRLKNALSEQLDEIRSSAIMCEDIMESHLNLQRKFRSIPIEEVDRRMEYCRAKFLKCRLAILEKFKTFVRALKWVHLSPQRVRRGSYTRIQNNILRLWLFTHFNDPYPTAQEKSRLMQECRMNDTQISNWFINSRVRIWKPCLNVVSQSQAAQETVRQLEDNREERRKDQARAKRRRGASRLSASRGTERPTPEVGRIEVQATHGTGIVQGEGQGSVPASSSGHSSSSATVIRKVETGELIRRW